LYVSSQKHLSLGLERLGLDLGLGSEIKGLVLEQIWKVSVSVEDSQLLDNIYSDLFLFLFR